MAIVGVDIGGTKVAVAFIDSLGEIYAREEMLLDGASGDDAFRVVTEAIALLRKKNPCIKADMLGVCIPGIVDSKTDTVWAPNIPGWESYPLRSNLSEATGLPEEKIRIESDRTCYILGELWRGVAQGCKDAIYLAVGTGIGAGILIDGRIIHGANDIVGATGWMALQTPYSEEYTACGCCETFASGNGIATQAQKELRFMGGSYNGELSKKEIGRISSYDIFAAYGNGDPIAVKVIDKAIEMWGMAAANLVSLFNPEKIIFGGGVFGPATQFIERIYDEALKWGQPISMKSVKFCASELQGDAALCGAAYATIR